MARQILKAFTMLLIVVGFAVASATSTHGQTGARLSAHVPFDFIVGSKELPSGKYKVEVINSAGNALSIRSGNNQVLRLTYGAHAKSNDQMQARLVFHRYGSTYFLSQVWMAGATIGRELPKTSQERAIERELVAIALKNGLSKPVYEVVEIVATFR